MTTKSAAEMYLQQHLATCAGKDVAVYNPNEKNIEDLPIIYGFNNGGGGDMWYGQLLSEDGTPLGAHLCSHEAYMWYDLGILEGARPDRHEDFKAYYPDGYKMEFVRKEDIDDHEDFLKTLKIAIRMQEEKNDE